MTDDLTEEDLVYDRPRTRGDCADVPRPCPYVGCKYSLYFDSSLRGTKHHRHLLLAPEEIPPNRSCALDVADDGGLILEEIGKQFGWTREYIRQIEAKAIAAIRKHDSRRPDGHRMKDIYDEPDSRESPMASMSEHD